MVKEEFCGLCTVVPLALTGAGLAATATKEDYRKQRKLMIGLGILILLISIGIYIWYSSCDKCRA
jgi:tellurite resistance protein TehA-like permease